MKNKISITILIAILFIISTCTHHHPTAMVVHDHSNHMSTPIYNHLDMSKIKDPLIITMGPYDINHTHSSVVSPMQVTNFHDHDHSLMGNNDAHAMHHDKHMRHAGHLKTMAYYQIGADIPAANITGIYTRVVSIKDNNVTTLPNDLLHHIQIFLRRGQTQQRKAHGVVYASGSELNKVEFPAGFAFPTYIEESLVVKMHLHNPLEEKFENVHVQLILETTQDQLKPVTTAYWINAMHNKNLSEYDIYQKGEHVYESQHSFDTNGSVIAIANHVHQYGESIKLYEEGNLIYDSQPIKDQHEKIIDHPTRILDPPLKVYSDRNYTMKTTYNAPTDQGIQGAMGMLFAYMDATTIQ